jgi:diadenosine tetraphosphatase ApaH/serine/threonine PP2A family protein phosphatase
MAHLKRLGALAVALLISAMAFAEDADSAYVLRDAQGKFSAYTVTQTAEGLKRRSVELAGGSVLSVAGVGNLPAFSVKLRPPATPAVEVAKTRKASPIFVVADTHGEYEIFAAMLQAHKVVDQFLRWNYGHGNLVVLGDVFDRGAHQVEILWLLYELEDQARRAGGAVHFVLGNHELMVLGGDLRYLNAKYRATATAFGASSYAHLFSADTVLGQWLRSRPALLRINDLLYLHGGLSPRLVERNLTQQEINASIRAAMSGTPIANDADRQRAEFLMGEDGPLWYRGYFPENPTGAVPEADVRRVLEHFGAMRIIVGHTRVPTIQMLYQGRVVAVQVYPRRTETGVEFEALLIRGGNFSRCRPDGVTERILPPGPGL